LPVAGGANIVAASQPLAVANISDDMKMADFTVSSGLFLTISGRATGGQIEASAMDQNFSADLSLSTRGNRQFVLLRPRGTNIAEVSLELNRR
jgi:hypothetical protein